MFIIRDGVKYGLSESECFNAHREFEATVIENMIIEDLGEKYSLNEKEIERCRNYVISNIASEGLYDQFYAGIRRMISGTYYSIIEPERHFIFRDGTIAVELEGYEKIELDCMNDTIRFKDSVFPCTWWHSCTFDNDIAWKLYDMLHQLPDDEEIIYPYVQTWHKLETWKKEGYTDEILKKLESILDGTDENEDIETTDLVLSSYYNRISINSFRLNWPNWLDKVIEFKKDEKFSSGKELVGDIKLLLKNGDICEIEIMANARKEHYRVNGEYPMKWQIHSWHSLNGRGFPMFTNDDNAKMEEYLLNMYPIESRENNN